MLVSNTTKGAGPDSSIILTMNLKLNETNHMSKELSCEYFVLDADATEAANNTTYIRCRDNKNLGMSLLQWPSREMHLLGGSLLNENVRLGKSCSCPLSPPIYKRIWIGRKHLQANVAHFDRDSIPSKRVPHKFNHVAPTPTSFVSAVKGVSSRPYTCSSPALVLADSCWLQEIRKIFFVMGEEEGGSILDIFDEMIKVGSNLAFTMDDAPKDMETIIGSNGGHDCSDENCYLKYTIGLETKKESFSDLEVKYFWGNYQFDHIVSEALGYSVLVRWNPREDSIYLLCLSMLSISYASNVNYGINCFSYQSMEWRCMVMGDFNEDRVKNKRMMGSTLLAQGLSNSIRDVKNKLSDIDKLLDQGGVTDDVLLSRMEAMKQLQEINSSVNCDFVQKAKVRWAIEGDENSKFFHGIINRKRANLSVKGDYVSDLETSVSDEEIRKAVWGCGENKSPGPDGFTFEFSESFWQVVGPDFGLAVNDFSNMGFRNWNSCLVNAIVLLWSFKFHRRIEGGRYSLCVSLFLPFTDQVLLDSCYAYPSTWNSIIKEFNYLKVQGIDVLSHCKIRIGNGLHTRFGKDLWIGDCTLSGLFPRLFALETVKDISVACKLQSPLVSSFRRNVRGGIEEQQLKHLVALLDFFILSNSNDRWVSDWIWETGLSELKTWVFVRSSSFCLNRADPLGVCRGSTMEKLAGDGTIEVVRIDVKINQFGEITKPISRDLAFKIIIGDMKQFKSPDMKKRSQDFRRCDEISYVAGGEFGNANVFRDKERLRSNGIPVNIQVQEPLEKVDYDYKQLKTNMKRIKKDIALLETDSMGYLSPTSKLSGCYRGRGIFMGLIDRLSPGFVIGDGSGGEAMFEKQDVYKCICGDITGKPDAGRIEKVGPNCYNGAENERLSMERDKTLADLGTWQDQISRHEGEVQFASFVKGVMCMELEDACNAYLDGQKLLADIQLKNLSTKDKKAELENNKLGPSQMAELDDKIMNEVGEMMISHNKIIKIEEAPKWSHHDDTPLATSEAQVPWMAEMKVLKALTEETQERRAET
ncbi:hypothetical protein Tco_1122147 [Tanacetum coccineum]|uniref:RNA-directed DNA polymerase, eukaryota n=1 Tax=Tanacetum coccineum TaxID=301880 RepID=A0ABQ5J206_9ASTR